MARTPMTRETLLPLLAAHVLERGIAGLCLRPLAKAAGTSDRMLLYHFGTKDKLVAELLEFIAAGFVAALDDILPTGRMDSRVAVLEAVAGATRGPAFQPYLVLWWQIVAGAAQGEGMWRAAAGTIADRMFGWIEDLLPADDPARPQAARHILTLIEGAQMLDAIGRANLADPVLEAGWALAALPAAP